MRPPVSLRHPSVLAGRPGRREASRTGFSLVEVAIALGVIGFALLAIIGLLGTGVDSNKVSIEETRAAAILTMMDADLRNTNPTSSTGKSAIYGLTLPYANATAAKARAFNTAGGLQANVLYTTGLNEAELRADFAVTPATRYQCSVVYAAVPTANQVTPLRGAPDRQLAGPGGEQQRAGRDQPGEGQRFRGDHRFFSRPVIPLRKISSCRRGFTLVEVLVAVVLIALIGVLIVQLVSAATRATQSSNRGVDMASQVRLVFERLDLDLAALANRQDVDFVAANPGVNATGTDAYSLVFLTNVTSALPTMPLPTPVPSLNRGVSLVSYQIAQYTPPSGTNAPAVPPPRCLLRASKALLWTDASPFGIWRDATSAGSLNHLLPIPLLSASPAPSGAVFPVPTLAATDFDVVAPAVIRMVVGFQLYPDTAARVTLGDSAHTVIDPTASGGGTVGGQIVYSPPVRLLPPVPPDTNGVATTFVDLSRVSAVIVGLVAMDPEVVKRMSDDNVKSLAGLFPVPGNMLSPADNVQLPVGVWTPVAANESAMPTTVPLAARQSLRVFQRAFPVNPYGSKTLSP